VRVFLCTSPTDSASALAHIKLLYDVETQAKKSAEMALKQEAKSFAKQEVPNNTAPARADEFSDHDAPVNRASAQRFHELLVETRLRLRKDSATPRLAQFREWLSSQQAEHGGPVLPKSPMGQAIQYALNQWDALCVYTSDGRLAIDNNASENALRRVAVGRKNWLFAGSDNGGRTAATLFSLIATCQRHRVEPMAYLRDLLTRIAAIPVSQLGTLLPDRWQPAAAD
jgi:hypothetical protein